MKKLVLALSLVSTISLVSAQAPPTDSSAIKMYRESAVRINDLIHTKLDVRFDYAKSYMYGKAWITLRPHFYPTDSLTLDAKGMTINKVAMSIGSSINTLQYTYDGMQLHINLGKTYRGGDKYTVYIDYVSRPNELEVKGSAAITDAKGLYFINPTGEEKDKPTQIWTQGETEANSVWFPTIDKPNQKTTEEIYMTVPAKYVTLSNGLLSSQKKNADGTRTDYWKMDLPHAPYLFFMGVGDYAVIKDSYKGKEVSYYVEKEYASVARKIFGYTPEMIAFYSRITGVDYPWAKYSQIVGRDYVSGAMENTTATLHQESAQQDARELVDQNSWESTIAHELFHQWFGDLVTTESWSNLTLNESFANYSETLWDEYKHGKDAGAAQNFTDMQGYLQSSSENKNLVRYFYNDKEDVFDAVSYNKGGRILHMLRNYVGDSAFFKSLNNYLTTNKFKSAEAANLRLAFEETTGRDLHWFWNQWYYGSGHPKLTISYDYDDAAKQVKVTLKQTQGGDKVFRLPFAIDVYQGSKKQRYNVWMDQRDQEYVFPYNTRPDLVNVDADKILLVEKKESKTLDNYVFQYKNAGNYLDRREAIDYCAQKQDDPKALDLLKTSMKDPYFGLRNYSLSKLNMKLPATAQAVEPILAELAAKDPKTIVKAKAIELLGSYNKASYKTVFEAAIKDSSYSVAGAGLSALAAVDPQEGLSRATAMVKEKAGGKLSESVSQILISKGGEENFDYIAANFQQLPFGQTKFEALQPFGEFLAKVKNTEKLKKGIDMIVDFRDKIPAAYAAQTTPFINNLILKGIATKKSAESDNASKEQVNYINEKISGKKAF